MKENNHDFLTKLKAEANFQAKLNENKLIPRELDYFAALVVHYPWQIILILSMISALILTFV